MAKRGGLGRGLDALIPDKKAEKTGKSKTKAAEEKTDSKTTAGSKVKASEAEKDAPKASARTKTKTASKTGSKSTKTAVKSTSGASTRASSKTGEKSTSKTAKKTAVKQEIIPEVPETENEPEAEEVIISSYDSKYDVPKNEDEDIEVSETNSEDIADEVVIPDADNEITAEDQEIDLQNAEEADTDLSNEFKEEDFDADLTAKAEKEDADAALSDEAEETVPASENKAEDEHVETAATESVQHSDRHDHVIYMDISMVEPNQDQPRKYFDEEAIEELSDSIRQFGIIQPLIVQKTGDYYQIIAGERRWRAANKIGLTEVPVIVREFSNQEAVEVALIENIQREDLNPIEEAKAYQRLVTEYKLSQEEVAGRVSKSRSAVTNSMRLLKLDSQIQEMVETGSLSEGHARSLLPLPSFDAQKAVADRIKAEKLSVRQTEKIVRELLAPAGIEKTRKKSSANLELLHTLSDNLGAVLKTKVQIMQKGRHRGKIEIDYASDEELDRIYAMLRSLE